MEVRDLKRLMDAMAAAGLTELEFERRDGDGPAVFRVRLKRGAPASLVAERPSAASDAQAPPPAERASAPAPGATVPAPTSATDHLAEVTAPIVGTFYGAPSPDAPPFVKVGDRVERGRVLCIIEAMKLMNEIEAEIAGTVVEVLVQNEDPVEYGQVLFRIDPS